MGRYNRITPVEAIRFDGEFSEVKDLVKWLQDRTAQRISSVGYQPELHLMGTRLPRSLSITFEPDGNREEKNVHLLIEANNWIVHERGESFLVLSQTAFKSQYRTVELEGAALAG